MSDQEENTERRIVEVPSSVLLIREEREKSPILSEMVSAALVVAAETGLANLSAEELIRIGKTFYLKDGPGATDANIKAFSFFYKASQKGSSEADWFVYCCIRSGDGIQFDYPTSIEWLKKSAAGGNPDAQFRLSIYYLLGEEAPPDFESAKSLLYQSAEQENLNALFLKGHWGIEMCYDQLSLRSFFFYSFHDVSLNKNEKEYFGSLAMQGDPQAQYTLSLAYRLSRFEQIHYYELAEQWAYRSAENGCLKGKIECRDTERYLDACLAGDPEGMALYGKELQDGKVNEDLKQQCIYWFKKSAELEFPTGIFFLAKSYLDGNCIEKDERKAISLLKYLASIGHSNGTELYLSKTGKLYSDENSIFLNHLLIEEIAKKGHAGAISLMIFISGFNASFSENKKLNDKDRASNFYYWIKKGYESGNVDGLLKAAYCLYGQGKYLKTAYLYITFYYILNKKSLHCWYLEFKNTLVNKIPIEEIIRLEDLAKKELKAYDVI
jgi:TPR repeat protein